MRRTKAAAIALAFWLLGSPSWATTFASDDFSGGTSGDLLQTHTDNQGHSWAVAYDGGGLMQLSGLPTDKVGPTFVTGPNASYKNSVTPASADYSVSGTVKIFGSPSQSVLGVAGRLASDGSAGYMVLADGAGNTVGLYTVTGSSGGTLLGSAYSHTPADGDVIKLVMSGNQISAVLNGTTVVGPLTDSTTSATGVPGMWGYNNLSYVNAVNFSHWQADTLPTSPTPKMFFRTFP